MQNPLERSPRAYRTLRKVRLPHPTQEIAFVEYRNAVRDAQERLGCITESLRVQSGQWRMLPMVQAPMCLRGFDFTAAVTIAAEPGDPRRFAHPSTLMAYLGLVPSEFSSGKTRQGSVTKAGSQHVRRMLVAAAWTYCHSPRVSRPLEGRQEGQPQSVRDISWRARLRLTQRFRHLRMGRKLPQTRSVSPLLASCAASSGVSLAMKCGSQPADIRVIHRRTPISPRVALLVP